MLVSFSFDASLFEVLALGIVHRNAPALHRMNHWGHDAARDAKDGPSQAYDELASGLLLLLVEAALLLAQAPIDLGPEADVQRVGVRRALGQRQDLDLSFCLRSLTRSRLVPRRVIVFQKGGTTSSWGRHGEVREPTLWSTSELRRCHSKRPSRQNR